MSQCPSVTWVGWVRFEPEPIRGNTLTPYHRSRRGLVIAA